MRQTSSVLTKVAASKFQLILGLSCYQLGFMFDCSSSNCPAIKIGSRSYGTLGAKTKTQFLRLSLPIKCNDKYLANKP